MPSIDFPNSPSVNDVFTASNTSWKWNGSTWDIQRQTIQGVQGIQGFTGTGVQGLQGLQGPSGSGGGGGSVTVSDTPPSTPTTGDLWFESDTTKKYVYYDSYWVEASSPITTIGNLDGGAPDSNYGGMTLIDAGTV